MKISISKKLIMDTLKRRLVLIVFFSIFIIIIWLGYFEYQYLYSAVIAPKEINQSEIIAKKQKVDLELFNTINEKITDKKSVSDKTLQKIKNPFE